MATSKTVEDLLSPQVLSPAALDSLIGLPTETRKPSSVAMAILERWAQIAGGSMKPDPNEPERVFDFTFNQPRRLGWPNSAAFKWRQLRMSTSDWVIIRVDPKRGWDIDYWFGILMRRFGKQVGSTPATATFLRNHLSHLLVGEAARGTYLGMLMLSLQEYVSTADVARWATTVFQLAPVSPAARYLATNAWWRVNTSESYRFVIQAHGSWYNERGRELGPVSAPPFFLPLRLANTHERTELAQPWLGELEVIPLVLGSKDPREPLEVVVVESGDPDIHALWKATVGEPAYMTGTLVLELLFKKAATGTY